MLCIYFQGLLQESLVARFFIIMTDIKTVYVIMQTILNDDFLKY